MSLIGNCLLQAHPKTTILGSWCMQQSTTAMSNSTSTLLHISPQNNASLLYSTLHFLQNRHVIDLTIFAIYSPKIILRGEDYEEASKKTKQWGTFLTKQAGR